MIMKAASPKRKSVSPKKKDASPKNKSPSPKEKSASPKKSSSGKKSAKSVQKKVMKPSPPKQNGPGPDEALVERAVQALVKYSAQTSNEKRDLLEGDAKIQVQLSLQVAPQDASPKPIRVMVPHPLFKCVGDNKSASKDGEEAEVCLIVKEESKVWVQSMVEKFPQEMGCIKKVLGLQSLRKKHAQYEQRRALLQKYNIFMADDRILPMLSKQLGKDFFKAKKLPIPITLTRKESLPFTIQRALTATFMTVSTGTCITIKAGHTGMSEESLVANIMAICQNGVEKIPRKWANIQMIGIKTPDSVSLPIYNKTHESLREIAELAGLKPVQSSAKFAEMIDRPQQEQAEKEGEAAKDASNKRKKELKSPLLQALKKQKKDDKEKVAETKAKKEAKSEVKTPEKRKDPATPQSKKSNKKKRAESDEPKPEPSPTKKGRKSLDKSETKAVEPAKVEEKPKGKKEAAAFVAAKKFKGSKKGYVFKMAKQGLGYYVDDKPVVDKMAIEAIMRLKKQSRRGGARNNKNKYKGTRRF